MFYIILLLLPVFFSVLKPVDVQLAEDVSLLGLFQCLTFPVPLSFVSVSTVLTNNLRFLILPWERVPHLIKNIYLYPLTERFREALHQQRLDRKERRKRGGNR
jgi:hypothetical protein